MKFERLEETIFAPAGAVGAAISVMRLSGEYSRTILEGLCGKLPQPRQASVRRLRAWDGSVLDHAMVLWLPGPQTYTGQDMAELHLHGGRAVLQGVSAALINAGAHPAEPGEFTRRAFLAGRMDLLEAEGVADLIAAETEAQRKQALRQMDGAQSGLIAEWRVRMTELLAQQEALIDFADEDLPAGVEAGLLADMATLQADLTTHAYAARQGERLRNGLIFAIVGAPNVGKSSLLNILARRDAAIVSPMPGTTRDPIEVHMDFAGVPVTLVDTAGLREGGDAVEQEGMRRALARAESADLVIDVTAGGNEGAPPRSPADTLGRAFLFIGNKCDLAPAPPGALPVSAKTGEGIDALVVELTAQAHRLTAAATQPLLNRARHVSALHDAASALAAAGVAPLPELRAEELRLAMRALGRITGAVEVEDILDVVFGSFCIGK